MKKAILILFLLFLNLAYSQDYYFYHGVRINLEPRSDRAAVVLNSNYLSQETRINSIKSLVDNDIVVAPAGDNCFLLKFKNYKSVSEIQSLASSLTSRSNIVKFATPVYFGESPVVMQIPIDEFIVRLNNPSGVNFLQALNAQYNIHIVGNVFDEKGFLLKSNDGVDLNALELSAIYFNTGLFEYAEPNFVYPESCLLNSIPNDPLFEKQWALRNTGQTVPTGGTINGDVSEVNGVPDSDMDVDLAWDLTTGNPNIKIGILDTGIDSTHPDFEGSLLTGYDAFYNQYGVPADSSIYGGHGTCAAGLVIAKMNNSTGISGVAPSCKLMSFRIFNQVTQTTSVVAMSRAFDTAKVLGIDILSNSWDGNTPTSTLTQAIDNVAMLGRLGNGSIILFSSGNNGRNSVWYPSYLPSVISVGASTPFDQKKAPGNGNQYDWGGNYGEDINGDLDIVAPAITYTTDIQGTYGYEHDPSPDGDYFGNFSGTSSSCPNTAGVVALILSINPNFSKSDVLDKLYRGCDKIENTPYNINKPFGKWSMYCGYGRVNAYNSVKLAMGADITPPTINHQNILSRTNTHATLISAEIVDQDGSPVPTTGGHSPKIFFRTNRLNGGWSQFDSAAFSYNDGNDFYFKIPCQGYETQVQYYITAEDNSGNLAHFPFGAPDPLWLCYYAIGEMVEVSSTIPQFSCVSWGSTISPPVNFGNFIILNTQVKVTMHHPRVSDVIMILYSPGTDANTNRKCIFASNGGFGADIDGALITDTASNFWASGTPPYTDGIYKADYFLKGFNGTNAEGDWKIINYEIDPINFAIYDSVKISFTKTTGVPSSSVRFNSEEDSVLYFGTVTQYDSLLKEFYVKNAGTSDMQLGNITFSGEYADDFYIESYEADPVLPGDSARISVYARPVHSDSRALITAVMNVETNDPSKPVFEVSLQFYDRPQPVELSSFTSSVSGRNVILNWATSMEENNSGFEIQRAVDGRELLFVKAGFVEGSGNSSNTIEYSFKDNNLNSGKYKYRLKQIDYNGNFEYHDLSEIVNVGIPSKFSISQNYPNPFNPTTKIDYDIASDGKVMIKLYDISGREIRTLTNEFKTAGYYSLTFNAADFASGAYFYRIEVSSDAGNFSAVRKMIILK